MWLSQIVSFFGDWFNFIAATELVTSLTNTGSAISILVGVRTVAPVLGAPLAPYIAARIRRRTVLILSDLLRVGVVLALLLVDTVHELWLLYTLIAVQGFLSGIFYPIRLAIIPDVVANEAELGAANTLGSLSWTAMVALGTALGGVATTYLGIQTAFIIDACTFLLSAFLLLQLQYQTPHSPRSRSTHRETSAQEVTFGDLLRFLQRNRDLLWLALKKTLVSIFSYNPTQVLQIMLSKLYPHIGPSSLLLGVIFSVGGCVSFFSPLVVRLVTGDNHSKMRRAMLLAYLISAMGMFMQGFVPPFAVLLLGVALRAVGAVVLWTFSSQLLLSLTPSHMRDHILSFEFFMLNLLGAVGVAIPDVVAERLDLGIMGAFTVLTSGFLILAVFWGLWLRTDHSVRPLAQPDAL